MKNHPLFPEAPDADILAIHVTRWQDGAPKYAAQKFDPEALTEIGQIWERYGGGRFVIVGRGAKPGRKGEATAGIIANQEYVIDGPPKPLNPVEVAAVAPAAAPAGALVAAPGGELGSLIGVMLTQAGEDRRMMMQLLSSIANRPAPPPPPSDNGAMQAMAAMFQSQSQTMTALLTQRAPGPTGAAADPIKLVLDVLEMSNDLRAGAAEAIAGKAGAGELDLGALAAGAEKVIGVIRKAKDLAEGGGSPEQAAALAAEAAEG